MKLEELRTKEEIIKYFKQLGKNITEEEIDALKQSYEQTEENNDTLNLQQLDNVAGGSGYLIFCPKRLANGVREDNGRHNLSEITLPNETSYFGGLSIFFDNYDRFEPGTIRMAFYADHSYISTDPSVLKELYPPAYDALELLAKHVDELQFKRVPNRYGRITDPDPLAKTNLMEALKSPSESRDHSFEETYPTAIEDFRKFISLESRRRSPLPADIVYLTSQMSKNTRALNYDNTDAETYRAPFLKAEALTGRSWWTGRAITKPVHVPNINEDGIGSSTDAYDEALDSYGGL